MSRPEQPRKPGGGSDIVWSIIGTLVAGVLAWGAIGILVGAAGAFYLIIRRYGSG
jgi:hypothetical protein